MVRKIAILLEMIKFKLTIFAMPFAFTGAFLAAGGVPPWPVVVWVVVAMIGARTAAMGFNRIVDVRFDGANPRTSTRALPAGDVSLAEAWSMVVGAEVVFFISCAILNQLTLVLSPFALGLTLFYSYTKRFTSWCHIVLGIALAFSPLGGWVAVTGSLHGFPWVLALAVLFWVAGFDTIYACLDADFDRRRGLYSLPSRLGSLRAFRLAGTFHVVAFILFSLTGLVMGLHPIYYLGIVLTALALFTQHRLVRPDDLSRIHASFFSMNGTISVVIFCATWLALLLAG